MKTSRLWLYRLLTAFMPENKFYRLKAALLRWCGATVGENVRICSSAYINGNGTLKIGSDVWIGERCFIVPSGSSSVEIGDHCDLAPEVMLLNGSHQVDGVGEHVAGAGYAKSVIISSGCWLGARSVVLPGVVLGRKTLVAAGSVVAKSVVEGCCLVAGVPAVWKKGL